MTRPSRVRMHVLTVHCKHCGQEVKLELPDGDEKQFGEKLAEVEAMAERAHKCPKGEASR